jgi:hypothetical protein
MYTTHSKQDEDSQLHYLILVALADWPHQSSARGAALGTMLGVRGSPRTTAREPSFTIHPTPEGSRTSHACHSRHRPRSIRRVIFFTDTATSVARGLHQM